MRLITAKVEGETREDLLTALRKLGDDDPNFNGENGKYYFWEEVDQEKYESNMEYLLDELKDVKDDSKLIKLFVDRWMEDDDYFEKYSYQIMLNENEKVEFIAIAYTIS